MSNNRKLNQRWGLLAKRAAEISGRSMSTVYAVLSHRMTSEPVQVAIEQARESIRQGRKRKA